MMLVELTMVPFPLPWTRISLPQREAMFHGVPPPGLHILPWVRGDNKLDAAGLLVQGLVNGLVGVPWVREENG